MAEAPAGGARRTREDEAWQPSRHRALRRRARRRHRADATPPRSRLPGGPAPSGSAALSRQTAENQAEDRMPDRRLCEGGLTEQRRDTRSAARGVVAIDERSCREENEVLQQSELEREASTVSPQPLPDLVIREPEDRSVERMDRDPERTP